MEPLPRQSSFRAAPDLDLKHRDSKLSDLPISQSNRSSDLTAQQTETDSRAYFTVKAAVYISLSLLVTPLAVVPSNDSGEATRVTVTVPFFPA